MRVPQFMVGFGPTVWSRRRGETEYGIKAIPLGGYIRIVGMIPPAEEGESKRATRMRSFIAEVRGQALNDVLPSDGGRVFYAKPWWQRVIVMFAGPVPQPGAGGRLLHVILRGLRRPRADTTIARRARLRAPGRRRDRGRRADACSVPIVPAGRRPGSARRDAGLRPAAARARRSRPACEPGDTIRRHRRRGGRPRRPTSAGRRCRRRSAAPNTPVDLTVERDGEQRDLTVTPIENTRLRRPRRATDRDRRLRRRQPGADLRPGSRSPRSRLPRRHVVASVDGWSRSRSGSRRCSARRSWARSATPGPDRRGRRQPDLRRGVRLRGLHRPPRRSATSSSCSPA